MEKFKAEAAKQFNKAIIIYVRNDVWKKMSNPEAEVRKCLEENLIKTKKEKRYNKII
jgi:hypothetical protein